MKRIITATTDKTTLRKLSNTAQDIADSISEFLDATSRMDDLNDYLDEYDLEHISKAMDALYDAAMYLAHG